MSERRALALTLAACLASGALMALPPARSAAATTTQVTQRYSIVATLDVATGRLDAHQSLTVVNRAGHDIDHINLSVIPRALGYLVMDAPVTVNGEAVETRWTTGTNLRVPLHEPLAPHRSVTLDIRFGLRVGSTGGAFTARLTRDRGVLSFAHWFPILSREHDAYGVGDPQVSYTAELIRLDLTTTAPLPRDAVACPGLVRAPATSGTRWTCEVGKVRDFSFVVNPAFRLTQRRVGLTELRIYTETVDGERTADMAASAMSRLNELFGTYPWPDFVMAEVGATDGFSMEYPRAIHLTRGQVTDAYIINHETAHQWFYAQVGNDQQLEPWLDEAFADFSARLVMGIGENQCGTREVDSPVFAWEAGATTGGDWLSCDGYFQSVFYQGTEFINAVRARMGDEAFFTAMREWVADNRFEVATGRRLLHHLQASTDADLLPVYRAYLSAYDRPLIIPQTRRPLPRHTAG